MKKLQAFRFEPGKETLIPAVLVAGGIVVLSILVWSFGPKSPLSAGAVTIIYSLWVAASLLFAYRVGSLSEIGLTKKRLIPAIILGVLLGALSVAGNNQTPEFQGATIVIPAFLSLLTLVVTGLTAAFCESLAIGGYLFFRLEKAFGPIVAVVGVALTALFFHLAFLFSPGSIPSVSGGIWQLVAGLFFGGVLIALGTYLTRNVIVGFLQNGLANIFINLYRLDVSPQDVLIAQNSVPWVGMLMLFGIVWGIAVVARKTHAPLAGSSVAGHGR